MVAFLNRFRSAPTEVPVADTTQVHDDAEDVHSSVEPGKEAGLDSKIVDSGSDFDAESISKDAQAGVQKIEATTQVWSKNMLILAYAL